MSYARDCAVLTTPIGTVRVEGTDAAIESIRLVTGAEPPCPANGPAVATAAEQIEAWFAGRLQHFSLPLAPAPTPRAGELREGLIAIGFGDTISYGELARQLGSAARAIGQLCARNPFPIVVPCHRVLSGGGAPERYSAGAGPATKFWLLEHERCISGKRLL